LFLERQVAVMAEKYRTREERRKQAESNKKSKPKSKGLFKRIFLILITLGIVGMIVGGATFAYFISDAPKLDEKLLKDPVPSKVYADDGKTVIDELGPDMRDYVAYDDVPQLVVNAFLATEDVRFFEHHGIDVRRLGGAVLANVTNGFGSQGASTITQQVVKRSYLTADKTIKRKVQEMWLSFQLEQKYTKQEIFEMYVNKIFFANRANGIATAAKVYYGKELKDLKLNEAAMLVGLPQSPNRYDPFKYPDRAEKRRNVVLHLMNKHGFISKQQMEQAQSVPIKQGLKKTNTARTDSTPYDTFIDEVIKEVAKMGDYNVFTDGLEIYTTVDADAQKYVHKMLTTNDIVNFPSKKLQTGITLLDTKTGEIKAIGGSRNKEFNGGFNYATDTKRSPGSTIKPILDYGPAVEYLKWSTYHQIVDEPFKYENGQTLNNAAKTHYGKITIREALGRSLNIPAVKTFNEVGTDRSRQFAENLGIPLNNKPLFESAAIGAGLNVSSLDMAGAYSAFGNGGIYNKPHSVRKVVLRDKNTTIKNKIESKSVMKESTAFIITDLLKSVLKNSYGTGVAANISGMPVAGKTGTTNYTEEEKQKYNVEPGGALDAWFAGYTTNYTIGVWTGYEKKNDFLGKSSQAIPKQVFKNLMQHVSQGKQPKDFKKPSSVSKVRVVKGSDPAMVASDFTPASMVSEEYFVKGTEPTQVTKQYSKIDSPTISNASYDPATNEILLAWDYPQSVNDEEKPDFEVKVSLNGSPETVLKVSPDHELRIPNPQPGTKYVFTVTALAKDQRSDPATASVDIPAATVDPGQDGKNTNPDDQQPGDQTDPNQGNGGANDNQNGQGDGNTDNGTGNTGDNGNAGQGDGNTEGGNGQDNGNGNPNGNPNGNNNGNGNSNGNNNGTGNSNGTNNGTGEGTGSWGN
jgi:penicillin-binding protein 1A